MALKFKGRFKHRAMIDTTSLIDLVFLLVAFFMVSSSLGSESSVTVNLPRAEQTGDAQHGDMIISIDENNNIYINDVPYQKDVLLSEFKKRKESIKNSAVIIRGDKRANYETIVKIMDDLNRADIPRFTLSTVK